MMFDSLLNRRNYYVAISFKNEKRAAIDAIMPISEYRRMAGDYRAGRTTGTYQMTLDGHPAELTFPLQEIDTIHAVPESAPEVTK